MDEKTIQVIVCEDKKDVGFKAFRIFSDAIYSNPETVLGLATGSTPVEMYKQLIALHKEKGFNFSKTASFNLDEYFMLASDHPQSYRYFMNDVLFNHINIDKTRTHVLNGVCKTPQSECQQFEEILFEQYGGVDLQLLGIGSNGHIAFNEPGSTLDSRTRIVDLNQQTKKDNARFFQKQEDVPTQALTMGIGTILEARKIVLLATGENKAEAINDAINGPITPDVPASFLRYHPDCVFIVDKDAAAIL
ncbi:MAG: glucosamine-6-phosphate deaminase [Candidatus Saelkia tenebricola]|nr:glucosamine-6-phosphate deaminase [Candidatus Saelkia tenebricola]